MRLRTLVLREIFERKSQLLTSFVAILLGITFLIALWRGHHSVVDVTWGLGFAVIALLYLALAPRLATSGEFAVQALANPIVHWGRKDANWSDEP